MAAVEEHLTSVTTRGGTRIVADVGRPGRPPAAMPRRLLRDRVRGAIRQHRLTLVVAPRGYGKSSLVDEAADGLDLPVRWASPDPDDPAADWVPVILPPGGRPTCLVLDAQAVPLRPDVEERLGVLVDRMPSGSHVVVLARHRPDMDLSRRRAVGGLAEFGAADLRFDTDEVLRYLTGTWRLPLSPGRAREIEDMTEGWPALLHLVARHLDLRAEGRADHGRLPPPALAFVHDVLHDLSPEARQALRVVHDLDEVPAGLIESLLESLLGTDSDDEMQALTASGLLVAGRDGAPRPHRAVGEALAPRGPSDTPVARRGIEHCLRVGARDAAVVMALTAGDPDTAASLLDDGLPDLMALRGPLWLRALADREPRLFTARPRLARSLADVMLLTGDADALALMQHLVDASPDDAGLAARAAAHRARLRGSSMEDRQVDGVDVPHPFTHPLAVVAGAAGRHDTSTRLLERCMRAAVERGDDVWYLVLLADVAWAQTRAGRNGDAADSLQALRARSTRTLAGATPPTATLAGAQVALDAGRPERARRMVESALSAVSTTADRVALVRGIVLRAHVCASLGDADRAVEDLASSRQRLREAGQVGPLLGVVRRAEASLRLALGDPHALPRLVPELVAPTSRDRLAPDDVVLLARHLVLVGRPERALQLVAGLPTTAEPRARMEAHRAAALAATLRGDDDEASRHERAALVIAWERGLGGHQVDAAAPSPARAAPAVSSGPTARSRTEARLPAAVPGLTPREHAVLQLVADDLTNHEIAVHSDVSVNTVKSQLRSTYQKLGVGDRRAAVTRAGELGIL